MRIKEILPHPNYSIDIVSENGEKGVFDVTPYLELEAFQDLKDPREFMKIMNGGYFIEWDCGADLSADTVEAKTNWSKLPSNKKVA